MILSVSRRTDIPAFYSEWFMNRINAGYVYVRNPFNYNQISNIDINPDKVDCIVFWTKNPKPLLPRLKELDDRGYKYYFHYTITPYDKEVETDVIDKRSIINTFIELSEKIGKDKVILRYDPIIVTDKYSVDFHLKAFEKMCLIIHEYTNKIVFSFLDDYRKVSMNMKNIGVKELTEKEMKNISLKLVEITNQYGIALETCAEKIDLQDIGISHTKCIDGDLIEKIIGYEIKNKDHLDGNRKDCGCMKCIDIGVYNTCIHNCIYCYANTNKNKAASNFKMHDPNSPILSGNFIKEKVKERKDVKSYKIKANEQLSLFNK
ncbi:protein of unknown function [Clostridium amylolyticum]|uniref:DUF1848 domain-containing protein n=1 Tax=Clostridium amylolyticum TaxID=1121298 RepID=A0A1M6KC89_9CLOT|nr:DUF1848 domain-containing protein [Clostridium amylolyticum]SHJ56573.1 protein of unknown function [Clostridium amylolyticum]